MRHHPTSLPGELSLILADARLRRLEVSQAVPGSSPTRIDTNKQVEFNMKKFVICLLAASLLAACNKPEEPEATAPAVAPADPTPPTAQPRPVPAPEDEQGIDILEVAGVEFGFPHQVLYDILDTSKRGTPRHRVLVEIRSGDFNDVARQFGQSLVALGYTKSSDSNKAGKIEQVFKQAGKPTYYLLMQPAGMGPKLRNKASTGSIHVMWNIKD